MNVSSTKRKPDENEANARLIAAAPDLLIACDLAMVEIGASGNWMARDFGWPKTCTAIVEAIAKARGK